jgi:tetratricopeptide (TPR) repeat protein
VYALLKEHFEAIKQFSIVILKCPKQSLSYVRRGLSYQACENHPSAIQDFQKAILLESSSNKDAYYYMASSRISLRDFA